MMKRLSTLVVVSLLLNACSVLKAGPAAVSSFLPNPERMTENRERYPFHRVWFKGDGLTNSLPSAKIFVAPVSIDHLRNASWWYASEEMATQAIRSDAQELARFTRETFAGEFSKLAHYSVTQTPDEDSLIVEIAIVELTPTEVERKLLGNVVSIFLPGAGLLSLGSEGVIAMEANVRLGPQGEVLFMCSDRESGKLAPLSLNDFTYFSHARAIIEDWSRQWAKLLSSPKEVRVSDSLPFTLLPV